MIGVVVLAAGGSARMGSPKQLLAYRGRSLVRHAAETALTLGGPVAVVVGAAADAVGAEFAGLAVEVVPNPGWAAGMGTSVRAGVGHLAADLTVEAVVILLADQPLAGPGALWSLAARYAVDRPPVVASEYAGTVGLPALFDRALFPRLVALADAHGAKQVITAAGGNVARVPAPEAAEDVDTPLDYARLTAGG